MQFLLLATLYSGGALLALLILAIGWRVASGRGATVAFSIAAALCLVLQAVVLWGLSDMGRGWGGDAIDLPIAVGAAVTLAGLLALPAFVVRKFGERRSPQERKATLRRTACVLLILGIVLGVANSLRYAASIGIFQLIAQPRFLLVAAGGIVAAWGLWRGERWASWLALAVCAWEAGRFMVWLPSSPLGLVGSVVSLRGFATLSLAGAMFALLRDPPWRDPGVREQR